MKKRNELLLGSIRLAFMLLVPGLLSGIALLLSGERSLAFFAAGLFGLFGLLTLSAGGILGRRATVDNDRYIEAHYLALLNDAREEHKKFRREMNDLLSLGPRYQLILLGLLLMTFSATLGLAVVRGGISGFGFFLIVLSGLLFRIFSTLFPRRLESPEEEVTERDMPEMFRLIDAARAPLELPRPQRIFLYPGENCGVTRAPGKWRIAGEDWLIIGSYLLELLTPEELKNVFIHEFAHIGHGDTVLASKVASRLNRWQAIADMSQNALAASVLLGSFAETYGVNLALADRALSKLEERRADEAVLDHGDAESFARATLKMELLSWYINEGLTFSRYPADVRGHEEPPARYHSDLLKHFKEDFGRSGAEWMELITKRMSHDMDTHPSIRERLVDLGLHRPDWQLVFPEDSPLQREGSVYVVPFDAQWQATARESWADLQADFQKAAEVIRNFASSEDEDQNLEYGLALEDLGSMEEAADFYEELLKRSPGHSPSMFRLGGIRLAQNDPEGLLLMKEALDQEAEFIPLGLEAMQDYLYRNGLAEKRDELEEWFRLQEKRWERMSEEVSLVKKGDPLVEARISTEVRAALQENLSAIGSVRTVLVATKQLEHSGDDLLVLGMTSRQSVKDALKSGSGRQLKDLDLITEAMAFYKGKWILLDLHQDFFMTKPLTKVPGSVLIKR